MVNALAKKIIDDSRRTASIHDDELAIFIRLRFASFLDQFSAAHRWILISSMPSSDPLPNVYQAIQRECNVIESKIILDLRIAVIDHFCHLKKR
jgi:hypothetical protein